MGDDAGLAVPAAHLVELVRDIIRVGEGGFGEMVLPFENTECQCAAPAAHYKTSFKAAKDGEVFVYVNDSVISWLGNDRFYHNNKGSADLMIARRP